MIPSKYSPLESMHLCIRVCPPPPETLGKVNFVDALHVLSSLVIVVLISSMDAKCVHLFTFQSREKPKVARENKKNMENMEGGREFSCYLFLEQKLPHTEGGVRWSITVVKEPRSVCPQKPPAALNSVIKPNQNLLVEMLVHCLTFRNKLMPFR